MSMIQAQKLVFDIETAGNDYAAYDPTSQEMLLKGIVDPAERELAKEQLGFSPTTGFIVVIGVMNPETGKGAVFINNTVAKELPDRLDDGFEVIAGDEREILERFWQTAAKYNCFISFNGRSFDVPFLMIRSAVNGVKPTRNLWDGRYLYQQKYVQHIDLFDQLSGYGATRFRSTSLHFYAKAFGIKSPKQGEVTGENVSRYFKEGRVLEIARYNTGDLHATAELYNYWNEYLSNV